MNSTHSEASATGRMDSSSTITQPDCPVVGEMTFSTAHDIATPMAVPPVT